MGAWATARRPRGGVLVIHENRGLNDSIRAVAGRLAASGYSSLAIDLLSEEGGTGSFADEFEAMAALGAAPPSRFVADMKAGRDGATPPCAREEGRRHRLLLRRRHDVAPARLERVAWPLPFPSTARFRNGDLSGAGAAVLGIYAELDSGSMRPARRLGQRSQGRLGIRSSRSRARSRVLQPDKLTLRPWSRRGRIPSRSGLARSVRRPVARPSRVLEQSQPRRSSQCRRPRRNPDRAGRPQVRRNGLLERWSVQDRTVTSG